MLYIFFAIFAISFLIFIHELGHYFMAHHVGMRVETFSIGFGKPIFSWNWRGERWQICWLLLGGYVKIAGMDEEPDRDPYTIPDGFFGKSPLDRIKVAVMGPLVNLIFALLIFSFIWVDGGREKNFGELTHKIGWVDPESVLYQKGIRPGDEILSYDDHEIRSASDHLYAPMVSDGPVVVKGYKVDYKTGEKEPFTHEASAYAHPEALIPGQKTLGILGSASYVIYDKLPNGEENPLIEGSPLESSGIQYGDRIVWVDGVRIFSVAQLNDVLNQGRSLLTVKRGNDIILRRVPRVKMVELRLGHYFREEITDWQFEAGLNDVKLRDLYMIPYDLTDSNVVEGKITFLDKDSEAEAFPTQLFNALEEPLKSGDKILAVDGRPVKFAYELLLGIQENQVNIIVERDTPSLETISWVDADADFDRQIDQEAIQRVSTTIGTDHTLTSSGEFFLLNPVTPVSLLDFNLPPEKQEQLAAQFDQRRQIIEQIEDPERRNQALQSLDKQEKKLLIGLPNIQDRRVVYNPIPTTLFGDVFNEIGRTLSALVTGALSPKYVSGPVGIVNVVQHQSAAGMKEALFWIGVISLNLGFLNLLPIPMLDGGTIVFNIFEMVTGRRIPPKVMERMVIPFAVLLICFFAYVTYNDLLRIFGGILR